MIVDSARAGIESAIELESVSRVFRARPPVNALRDLSLTLPRESVTVLVGPNGAGKSTLLRILAGTIAASAGRVSILGVPLPRRIESVRNRIGVLPGNGVALYDRLSAREYLAYIGQLRGLPRDKLTQRIAELSEQMGLTGFLDRRCGGFSTGMRQRTSLAAAVIHRPELVLLDEPTTGLDIQVRGEVLELIASLAGAGTTLIVSTHHPEEIAPFATHRVELRGGELADPELALQEPPR